MLILRVIVRVIFLYLMIFITHNTFLEMFSVGFAMMEMFYIGSGYRAELISSGKDPDFNIVKVKKEEK